MGEINYVDFVLPKGESALEVHTNAQIRANATLPFKKNSGKQKTEKVLIIRFN